MKSYKVLLNEVIDSSVVRPISYEEANKLKKCLFDAYCEIDNICQKRGITIYLIGGSTIGAVRHHGFIPWDDDLDLAITRSDFEKLKKFFKKDLSQKYMLSSPNYGDIVNNRFPQILIKGTRLVSIETEGTKIQQNIALDLFVIENVPDNYIHRLLKGILCNGLMYIAGHVQSYEFQSKRLKEAMCRTKQGKRIYNWRMIIGFIFSFFSTKRWFNLVDYACRYSCKTKYMSIPTGRKHYFGEICNSSAFVPASKGVFNGRSCFLPGDCHEYLSNLYGDYMIIPDKDKRERHFVCDISFNTGRV